MHVPDETLLPQDFPGGVLRRLRRSDVAAFQAYRSVPELGRFQGWSPMQESEAAEFLAGMNAVPLFRSGEWVQLGIAEPESDRLVGDIGLYLSGDGSFGRVGFTLAPSVQGRGIATSAVRLALMIFFRVTSARHMEGITDSRNARSIRLLERIGFRYLGSTPAVFRGEACVERTYLLPREGV